MLYLNISVEWKGDGKFEISWCDHPPTAAKCCQKKYPGLSVSRKIYLNKISIYWYSLHLPTTKSNEQKRNRTRAGRLCKSCRCKKNTHAEVEQLPNLPSKLTKVSVAMNRSLILGKVREKLLERSVRLGLGISPFLCFCCGCECGCGCKR